MHAMKFEKRVLTTLNRCYSATDILVDGVRRILVATEGEGACLAWAAPGYEAEHAVWEGPAKPPRRYAPPPAA